MTTTQPLRFGIIQGRLTPSPNNCLQYFPQASWAEEFPVAAQLGFSYIELFVEREHNAQNPVWSPDGLAAIHAAARKSQLSLYSIVNDYVIEHSLAVEGEAVAQSLRLIGQAAELGMRCIVLPLFERGELTIENAEQFVGPLRTLAAAAQARGVQICLETLLDGAQLRHLLDCLDHEAIVVCFDTGNRAALQHDVVGDIRLLGDRLQHVHIKDKNRQGTNVLLGDGLVNFYDVGRALRSIGYRGAYSFETFRGTDPVRTAGLHRAFLEFVLSETQHA